MAGPAAVLDGGALSPLRGVRMPVFSGFAAWSPACPMPPCVLAAAVATR